MHIYCARCGEEMMEFNSYTIRYIIPNTNAAHNVRVCLECDKDFHRMVMEWLDEPVGVFA